MSIKFANEGHNRSEMALSPRNIFDSSVFRRLCSVCSSSSSSRDRSQNVDDIYKKSSPIDSFPFLDSSILCNSCDDIPYDQRGHSSSKALNLSQSSSKILGNILSLGCEKTYNCKVALKIPVEDIKHGHLCDTHCASRSVDVPMPREDNKTRKSNSFLNRKGKRCTKYKSSVAEQKGPVEEGISRKNWNTVMPKLTSAIDDAENKILKRALKDKPSRQKAENTHRCIACQAKVDAHSRSNASNRHQMKFSEKCADAKLAERQISSRASKELKKSGKNSQILNRKKSNEEFSIHTQCMDKPHFPSNPPNPCIRHDKNNNELMKNVEILIDRKIAEHCEVSNCIGVNTSRMLDPDFELLSELEIPSANDAEKRNQYGSGSFSKIDLRFHSPSNNSISDVYGSCKEFEYKMPSQFNRDGCYSRDHEFNSQNRNYQFLNHKDDNICNLKNLSLNLDSDRVEDYANFKIQPPSEYEKYYRKHFTILSDSCQTSNMSIRQPIKALADQEEHTGFTKTYESHGFDSHAQKYHTQNYDEGILKGDQILNNLENICTEFSNSLFSTVKYGFNSDEYFDLNQSSRRESFALDNRELSLPSKKVQYANVEREAGKIAIEKANVLPKTTLAIKKELLTTQRDWDDLDHSYTTVLTPQTPEDAWCALVKYSSAALDPNNGAVVTHNSGVQTQELNPEGDEFKCLKSFLLLSGEKMQHILLRALKIHPAHPISTTNRVLYIGASFDHLGQCVAEGLKTFPLVLVNSTLKVADDIHAELLRSSDNVDTANWRALMTSADLEGLHEVHHLDMIVEKGSTFYVRGSTASKSMMPIYLIEYKSKPLKN